MASKNKDPFLLFYKNEIDNISPDTLAQFRKQKLLELEVSGSDLLEVNGHSFDKNSILQCFELLKTDFELYAVLHKSRSLQDFLNNGNVSFFKDEQAYLNLVNNVSNNHKLNELVIEKLKRTLPDIVFDTNFKSQKNLEAIIKYLSHIDQLYTDRAFERVFFEIQNIFEELTHIEPTLDERRRLKPDPQVKKYVNVPFYKKLKVLPNSFSNLRRNFGIWCNDEVLLKIRTIKDYSKVDRGGLKILHSAAQISEDFVNIQTNRQIKNELRKIIDGGSDYQSSDRSWWNILWVIVIIVKVLFWLSSSSSDSTPSARSYPTSTKDRNIATYSKEYDNAIKKQRIAKNGLYEFTGDMYSFMQPQILSKNLGVDSLYLKVEVDVLPTKTTLIRKLITPKIHDYYRGKKINALIITQDKDLPEMRSEHWVKLDFRDRYIDLMYRFDKEVIPLTKENRGAVLKEKFVALGKLISIDAVGSKIIGKRDIAMSKEKMEEKLNVTFDRSKNFGIELFDLGYDDIYDNATEVDSIRAIAIIKNLLAVKIPIEMGRRLGPYIEFAKYDLDSLTHNSYKSKNLKLLYGDIDYRFTSKSDGLSLYTWVGTKYMMNMFLDSKSGNLKAMTYGVHNTKRGKVELTKMVFDQ